MRSTDDARAGAWVAAAVRPFDEHVVTSVVPQGFAGYARVFHPAGLGLAPERRDVRWAAVAEANRRTSHPGMQWGALTGAWGGPGQSGIWTEAPRVGSLPVAQAERLAAILGAHTATPDRCWFAVWEGFADLAVPRGGVSLRMPERTMVVLRGPLSAAPTSLAQPPSEQLANLWWPDDRAWCVATEVDLTSTLVGGSGECVADLLAAAGIEAMPVRADQSITWDSDDLNPMPEPP